MPSSSNRKKISSNYIQIVQFDVNDYIQNPVMIKKLNEEKDIARAESNDLFERLEQLKSNNHNLDVQVRELEIKLHAANQKVEEVKDRSFLQFVVSLLGTIMIGVGTNMITSSAINLLAGWILIIFGVILEIVAFFMAFLPKIRVTTQVTR